MIDPATGRMAFLTAQMDLIARIAANMLGDSAPPQSGPRPGPDMSRGAPAAPVTEAPVEPGVLGALLDGDESGTGTTRLTPSPVIVPASGDTGGSDVPPSLSLAGLRPPGESFGALWPPATPERPPSGSSPSAPALGPDPSPFATASPPLAIGTGPSPDHEDRAVPQGLDDPRVRATVPDDALAAATAAGPARPDDTPGPRIAGPAALDAASAKPADVPGAGLERRSLPVRLDTGAAEPTHETQDARGAKPPTPATHAASATGQVPVIRHEAARDIDTRFLTDAASSIGMAGGTIETTGIAAALIFNAAMIPGWPPPRPFEMPAGGTLTEALLRNPRIAGTAEAMVEQVAGQIGSRALAEALRAFLKRLTASRRLRLLLGLTALSSAIDALLDAIERELLHLADTRTEDDHAVMDGDRRRQFSA